MEVKPGYKQTEAGEIPEEWEVDYVENLAQITTGKKNTQDRIEDGQYPFFVRSQTVERINCYSYDGEAVLTAGDGVGTGKVFHYINGKFDVHQRVYRISDFSPRLNGYFFFIYFSSRFYSRIMQMTAKSSVNSVRREMIVKMPVPLPPKGEQGAIAKALIDADASINPSINSSTKNATSNKGPCSNCSSARGVCRGSPRSGIRGRWAASRHFSGASTCPIPRFGRALIRLFTQTGS